MELPLSILGMVATAAFTTGLGLTLYGLKRSRVTAFVLIILTGMAATSAANIAGQRLDWQDDQLYLTEVRGITLPPNVPPPTARPFEVRLANLIPWCLSGAVLSTLVAMGIDTLAHSKRARKAGGGGPVF